MEQGEFRGVIGRHYDESAPYWPEPTCAPAGAPNVLMVVLDDVGFAQLGCFGSDIDTPVIDRLSENGLRYTNFHTTALCSPTRSCLLTGRNHHRNGMGRVIELATGFPGYDARTSRANGFLPEILVPRGYAGWAVGKWHLTPEDETHEGASRERWPLGRGFERFYGFFGGESHQFGPTLVADNHHVDQPRSPEDGYHLSEDIVDQTIKLTNDLRAVDHAKPWFCHLAFGACHSPHQSPDDWRERYRGRFDGGWDLWRDQALARQLEMGLLPAGTELSPRPDWVPAWDSLNDDERTVYARYMEAFAAFLSHTDHQIGRLVGHLDDIGELDDTLIMLCSDNGASSEGGVSGSLNDVRLWNVIPSPVEEALRRLDEIGGPRIHNNYPWGWTVAGNTPFKRWKRETHEGGVADPLVVHWPSGIQSRGEVRRQYVHAIDLVPTILDVAGITAPASIGGVTQSPIDGASFAHTFDHAEARAHRDTQYYEMLGCRALYHQGWKAVTYVPIQQDARFDEDRWELYKVDDDPSECHDLAAEHPERLQAMIERWWVEAARNDVLPLDNRPFSDFVFGRRASIPERSSYEYRPGGSPVPEAAAVNVRNRSHRVTAFVVVPEGGAEGVLLAQGSVLGGWSFHLHADRLVYVHNLSGYREHRVEAPVALDPGPHRLEFRFSKTGEHQGSGSLLVDGDEVGEGEIPRFTMTRFSLAGAGLSCGRSDPTPVCDDYEAPFAFTGTLHRVVVDVSGDPFVDPDAEAADVIAMQ